MKTDFDRLTLLDKELAELAPLVKKGYDSLGVPSATVEEAIRAAARQQIGLRNKRSAGWRWTRALAAAASLVILAGGVYFHATNPGSPGASATGAENDESLASFASLLLEIQGLNAEGFFMAEEEEALWL